MIDCEVKFGSYVPTVPRIYKDAAKDDDDNDDNNNEKNKRRKHDFQKHLDEEGCSIGPKWTNLKLLSIEPYNHDTSIFEFELPDPASYLRLPVTSHMLVRVPTTTPNNTNTNTNTNTNEDKKDDIEYHARPYTAVEEKYPGRFKIMVKLYKEWGIPESKLKQQHRVFLYSKTDHSYKPPGKVSSYIHSLKVGEYLAFKYNELCLGKISYPFEENITSITMIAVGAGVAPMIRILRALLDGEPNHGSSSTTTTNTDDDVPCKHVKKIRLLYGARTVADILQRKLLDKWHDSHERFEVCYCIGSRWNNVHFAAKTDQKEGPALPTGWDDVMSDRKELGWVDGDKVARRGASCANDDGHRVFICGLPGVYLALVGPRTDPKVEEGTQLHRIGYRDHQVVKF